MQPPPRYKIKGNENAMWKRGPGRRRIRRFAYNGEFQRSGRVSSTCTPAVSGALLQLQSPDHRNTDCSVPTNDQLLASINGPSPRKRKEYQCNICGERYHNSTRCPRIGGDSVTSKSIQSGTYVVGTDPVTVLNLDRRIYMEYGGRISCRIDDLQQAVNKLLCYTLMKGEDEFAATYEDIAHFVFNIEMERTSAISILEEALHDRQAIDFISSKPKVFLEYLLRHARHSDDYEVYINSNIMKVEMVNTDTNVPQRPEVIMIPT